MSDLVRYVQNLARDDVVDNHIIRDGRGNLVEVPSNKPLDKEDVERFFSHAGRRKEGQRILDFVFGDRDA
jgi:hypothetical protein